MDYGERTYAVLVVIFINFRWHSIFKGCAICVKLSAICPLRYAVFDTKQGALLFFSQCVIFTIFAVIGRS